MLWYGNRGLDLVRLSMFDVNILQWLYWRLSMCMNGGGLGATGVPHPAATTMEEQYEDGG